MAKKIASASDTTWKKYGKENPYFGVCTEEIFKSSNLTEDALNKFFESGKSHVHHVLDVLSSLAGNKLENFNSILDFGCGTGRLLVPFSNFAHKVTGVDVSEHMLAEAEKNLKRFGVKNFELIESNSLEILKGIQFDFVHTYIVLQHIPVHVGYGLIKSLLNLIKPGGCGMIHLTYSNEKSVSGNIKAKLRSKYKFIAQFFNLIKGKHPNTPMMDMNNYNLNKVFRIFETSGSKSFFVELTNHGGFRGACIYILK